MKIPKFTFTETQPHTIKIYDTDLKVVLRALDVYAEQFPHTALRVDDVKRVLTWDL